MQIAMKFVVQMGLRPPQPDNCPAEVWALVASCWAEKADDRPTFKEVLDVLDSFDNAALEASGAFPCHLPSAVPLAAPLNVSIPDPDHTYV